VTPPRCGSTSGASARRAGPASRREPDIVGSEPGGDQHREDNGLKYDYQTTGCCCVIVLAHTVQRSGVAERLGPKY
jgi:hypothetical protein